jgi:hypothetical protein
VDGTVNSENGFGALLSTPYSCSVNGNSQNASAATITLGGIAYQCWDQATCQPE